MIPFTSMADFYHRLKQDERYKLVAIKAYKESAHKRDNDNPSYEEAIKWAEEWISFRQDLHGDQETCRRMVDYFSKKMSEMTIFD